MNYFRKTILFSAGFLTGMFGTLITRKYQQDHHTLLKNLEENSQTAVLPNGLIEYAVAGEGMPVLVSHGTIGGYDQGLAIITPLLGKGFQFIAVSRAGYLRSEANTGLTPETQADSYAQLLDVLQIPKAAMIGVSGGTPSALQFGLRHPNRCANLIIMSGISKEAPPLPPMLEMNVRMQAYTMRHDFSWWFLYSMALPVILQANGVHPQLISKIKQDPHKLAMVRSIYEATATPSLRLQGTAIDDQFIKPLSPYPVESLTMPVLAVHSPTDALVPIEQAIWLTQTVPNGRLLEIPDGGHACFITRHEQVTPEVIKFLKESQSLK